MTPYTPDLSAMISTRICHDLINPIGAISNGLELLVELSQTTGPELGLITDSVASANAKLGYFRIAYGDARPESQLPTALAEKTVASMYSTGRFRAQWQVSDDPLHRSHVKLAFLLIQCIESSLPLGGLCVTTRKSGVWNISGSGSRVALDQKLWDSMAQNLTMPEASSSTVQFVAAAQALARLGGSLTYSYDDQGINVSLEV